MTSKYKVGTVAVVTCNRRSGRLAMKVTNLWWAVAGCGTYVMEDDLLDIRPVPVLDWTDHDTIRDLQELRSFVTNWNSGRSLRTTLDRAIASVQAVHEWPICPACGGKQSVKHDHSGDPPAQARLTLHGVGDHRACNPNAPCFIGSECQ